MKKLTVILLVSGFFSAASAQEVKKELPLQVNVSGIVYHTAYKGVYKETSQDVDGDYTAARIKPSLNFTDGNIDAVLTLEYDATFGQKASTAGTTDAEIINDTADHSSENVGLGADKKGLEVANAYIKSRVDGITGLTLTGGIANYDFPIVWGDNAPLASINFSNEYADFGLYYIKPSEGDNNEDKDDAQIYITDLAIKLGDSTIRPAFFAYQCKEDTEFGQFRDSTGYIYALSLNLVIDKVGLDAAGAYIDGKDKVGDVQYAAYAFDIAPYVKMDPFKFTAFLTYVSGDGDNAATDDESKSFRRATIDGSGAGINSFRLYIIEDAGSFTTNSDVTDAGKYDSDNGYTAYGLAVSAAVGPVTCKFQGAYAKMQKAGSGGSKEMGWEADANIGYALTRTSTFFVEGAYLLTGKAFENSGLEKQSAQYINVGMTYSM
jgi:hypothetical protein